MLHSLPSMHTLYAAALPLSQWKGCNIRSMIDPLLIPHFHYRLGGWHKDTPAECLENAAVYDVANLCQSILTIEFLGLGGRQN